jgi:ribosomal protein S18 acetylase RimI-like enzyme
MDVRTAIADDLGALTALAGAQLAEHALPSTEAELQRAVAGALSASDRAIWLVATDDQGAPCGFAYLPFLWSLEHGGRVAWLEEMYVLPAQRGRGVGTALLRAAFTEAVASGCKAVDLEVDDTHARAARLYEREGFLPLSRRRWVRKLP